MSFVTVIKQSHLTIESCCNTTIVQWRKCHVSKLSWVKFHYNFSFIFTQEKFIQCAISILYQPKILLSNLNPVQIRSFSWTWLKVKLFFWFYKQIKMFIWFSIINFIVIPKSYKPIRSTSNNLFTHQTDKLDWTFMAWSVLVNWNYWFNKVSLPQQ